MATNQRGSGARNRGSSDGTGVDPAAGAVDRARDSRRRNNEAQSENAERAAAAREEAEQQRIEDQISGTLEALPTPKINVTSSGVLRYPDSATGGGSINSNSDYVLFEFFKYAPPFRKQAGDANFREREIETRTTRNRRGSRGGGVSSTRQNAAATLGNFFDYNQANDYEPAGEDYQSIIMYMPEDVSTGFKSNWGGKAFSNIAAGILRSAGGEGLNKLDNLATVTANSFERLPAVVGSAAIRKAIQKITGDSLSNNDVFGSISGAILNPNVELLFESSDMRNFQLNFKLVPRNSGEVTNINDIVKIFKMCTLPQRNPGKVFGGSNQGLTAGFIGVPNLCRVSFMKGSGVHPVLPIYKMCAVTQVDVNYTPDGVYATYEGGQPVAIELSLNFQETKLVFADEVSNNSIR
jgi:hypothetical protein